MMRLACIVIAFAIVGTYADEPEKLVNGVGTTIEEYPFAASIRVRNKHMCGGALFSNRHIVTAAHCVEPFVTEPKMKQFLTVVTGTTYLNTGGEVHQVKDIHYHERYHPDFMNGYDIGIIELSKPVIFNQHQQPAKFATTDVARNDDVTTVAWGTTGIGKPTHNNLQKLDAKCMLAEECQVYHGKTIRIHPYEFCTLIGRGTGNCQGDSGSGIIRRSDRALVGVVSSGRPCAKGFPDIYTNLYPFHSWIRETTSL